MTYWAIPVAVVPAGADHHPVVLPREEDPHRAVRLAEAPVLAAVSGVLAAVAILVDQVAETEIGKKEVQREVLTTDLPGSKARANDVAEVVL
jgi:hypothetical protein